jgi:hypothetical protein
MVRIQHDYDLVAWLFPAENATSNFLSTATSFAVQWAWRLQGAVRAGCDQVPARSTEYGIPVPHIIAVALEHDSVIWESGTVGLGQWNSITE